MSFAEWSEKVADDRHSSGGVYLRQRVLPGVVAGTDEGALIEIVTELGGWRVGARERSDGERDGVDREDEEDARRAEVSWQGGHEMLLGDALKLGRWARSVAPAGAPRSIASFPRPWRRSS